MALGLREVIGVFTYLKPRGLNLVSFKLVYARQQTFKVTS
jgi:hypothetical protein